MISPIVQELPHESSHNVPHQSYTTFKRSQNNVLRSSEVLPVFHQTMRNSSESNYTLLRKKSQQDTSQ